MAQSFTLDTLDDEGEVGLLRIPRTFTLGPLTDEGEVGTPGFDLAWGPIPTTPYPGEPGGSPTSIIGDLTGGLSSPSVVLPESALQLIEANGDHVAWLAKAKGWTFRRESSGLGSGLATLSLSDPLAAELVWPRQLRFFDRGIPRERALLEPRSDSTVDQGEEAGQDVQAGGRGSLAILAAGLVEPIALDLQPVQDSMRFTFAHPDYDQTGWVAARNVGNYGRPTDWPGGGVNIWGPTGTHAFAPGGTVYFRGPEFTIDDDQVVAFTWHADNIGRLYLDGAEIDALSEFDSSNYLRTSERRYLLSAGTHMLAVAAFNRSSPTPGPLGNPGSIRVVARALDSNGLLGEILHYTSTAWQTYDFPQVRPAALQRPGWTVGEILNWLLDRWEDRGGLTIARSFTASRDSGNRPWPLTRDFTATIGNDLLAVALQLAEVYAELDMAPGSDLLHAWVKDTRGTVTAVSLPDGYSDPVDGCLLNLRHRTEPPLCTRALLRWRDGWTAVNNAAQIAAGVYVERHIQVPLVPTEAAAQAIGAELVNVYGFERVEASAELEPRIAAHRPGVGFDVADTVEIPDRDLVLVPQVVRSWSHSVDADGKIAWAVEAGDLVLNQQERVLSWLKSFNDGAIGGRTLQPSPYRQEVLPESERRRRDPILFDHDATDQIGESRPYTMVDFGTIESLTIAIPGGEGGSFDIYVNGVSVASLGVATTAGSFEEIDYKVAPGDRVTIYSDDPVAFVAAVRIS